MENSVPVLEGTAADRAETIRRLRRIYAVLIVGAPGERRRRQGRPTTGLMAFHFSPTCKMRVPRNDWYGAFAYGRRRSHYWQSALRFTKYPPRQSTRWEI